MRYKFYPTTSSLIFLGGIDSNLWLDDGKRYSRNFKQGYRVYGAEGIACTLVPVAGGLGGASGLYLVKTQRD